MSPPTPGPGLPTKPGRVDTYRRVVFGTATVIELYEQQIRVHTCTGQLVVDGKQVIRMKVPAMSSSAAAGPSGTDAELDTADELGRELVRLMRAMGRAKSHISLPGPDGLERAAYGLLFCLVHDGAQRTSQLADNLHTEISTVSRQASALVGHGLVERQADPDDGRATLLAPTTEGVRVFEQNRRQRNRWLAQLTADWPAGERERLTNLLDRLTSRIETFEPDTGQEQPQGSDA